MAPQYAFDKGEDYLSLSNNTTLYLIVKLYFIVKMSPKFIISGHLNEKIQITEIKSLKKINGDDKAQLL